MNKTLLNLSLTKKIILSVFCFFLFVINFSHAQVTPPSWMWVNSGTSTGYYSYTAEMAIDTVTTNCIYWGGRFGSGSVTFSTQSGSPATASFGCSSQLGVAQITTAGVTNWVQKMPCVGQDYGDGVAVDNSGNSYVGGLTQGGNNPTVGAFSSAGAFKWCKNSETGVQGRVYGVDVDRNTQEVYIATGGISAGTFCGFATAAGSNLTKLNSSGTPIWSRTPSGSGVLTRRVSVDPSGANIFVCGGYTGTPTFGTITAPASSGYSNFFVANYDASGNCIAVATATSSGIISYWDQNDVVCDAYRNVYVTGHFSGTANFGNLSVTSAGGYDIFVAKYNFFAGKWEWVKKAGGAGDDWSNAITIDKNLNVYITGSFNGNATFDPGGANIAVSSGTASDNTFVAKYANSNGAFQFVKTATASANYSGGSGIVVDKNNQVYVGGGYGGTPIFGAYSAVNAGASSGCYVAKLDRVPDMSINPQPAASYNVTDTYTLPYTITGTFTAGNVFTAQLSNSLGSFNTPVNIGSVTSTTGGNISITIPCVPPSPYYKIRILSSKPNYSSIDYNNSFISIVNPVISTISPNATSCVGGSNTLTVTGTGPFTWAPATWLNTTSGASVISTPTAVGSITYTVTTTAAYNSCFGTNTVTVTATAAPTLASVSASPSTICLGASSTLTATGSVGGYTWNPGALSGASVSVTPSTTTTYTVTGTLANGCSAISTVPVTVNPALTLPASAAPTSICPGGSSNLTASGSISGYTWSPATGLSATNIANPVSTPASSIVYTVTGTMAGGCVANNTVAVSVDVPKALGVSGGSYVQVANNSSLQTSANFTYELWVKPTSFTSANTYFENGIWGSQTTILRQDNPSTIYLHINTAVSLPLTYAPPLNVWTHLAVVRSGNTISLYANGVFVGNFTTTYGSTILPTNVMRIGSSVHTGGQYFIGKIDEFRLWNYARSAATLLAEMHTGISSSHANWANLMCYLKFNEPSGIYYDRSSHTNNATSVGGTSYVSIYPAGVSITGNATPCQNIPVNYTSAFTNNDARVTYSWGITGGGTINSGQGTNSINVTWTTTGAHTVTLTVSHSDECQSETSTPLAVNVGNTITSVSANVSICVNTSTTLTVAGTPAFTWSPATYLNTTSGASVISTPTVAGATTTYTVSSSGCTANVSVTATAPPAFTASASPSEICNGETSTLSVSPAAVGYNWSPAGSLNNATIASPTATPSVATTYTVTASIGGCPVTSTVAVSMKTPRAMSLAGEWSWEYAEVPYVDLPGDFTVEMWVKPNDFSSGYNTYFEDGNWYNGQSIILRQDDPGNIYLYLNGWLGASLPYVPPTGQWTHLALVLTSGDFNLYENGNYIGTFYSGFWDGVYPDWYGDPIHIGASVHEPSQSFNGLIDEFRIWDYARADYEIANDIHTDITTSHPNYYNLLAYYKLNENTGTQTDASQYGNSGWMNGGSYIDLYPSGSTVDGPSTACLDGSSVTYSASYTNPDTRFSPGYTWSVTGGNINSGQGTSSIDVTFTSAGSKTVSYVVQHSDECQSETASLTVSVDPVPGTWKGTVSTVWSNPANWACNILPTSTTDVIVPSTAPNMPSVNSAGAVCRSITINSGASLTTSSTNNLDVYGSWINNGTYTPNSGTITFKGTAAISGSSTTSFNNVLVFAGGQLSSSTASFTVSGNWTNNSTATFSGTNTITFNGTTAQTIGGTTTTTFNNVTINNATSTLSSATVTLGISITVNGVLTMTRGFMVTTTSLILNMGSSSSTSGTNANSYVNGPMTKTGTTSFIFPVGYGNGTKWARIAIGAPSTSTTFRAQYFQVCYATPSPMAATPTPVLDVVSHYEYWQLDRTVGTGNATVTLYWEDATASHLGDCTNLRVAHWNGSAWENNNDACSTTGSCTGTSSGTISTSAAVTSFSPFTYGNKAGGTNSLPIELINFTANACDKDVCLNWSTATEVNNNYFTVEKSKDGSVYQFVSNVDSKAPNGNSSSVLNYASVDNDPFVGVSYYRLKQTDFNGAYTYSNVEMINFERSNDFAFNIYPNPTSDGSVVNIEMNAQKGEEVLVVVYDVLGNENYSKVLVVGESSNLTYAIDPSNKLAPGIYLITATSEKGVYTKRLIVK